MSNRFEVEGAQHEALSALMDGELDAASVGAACAAWRSDAATRSTWHAYQLLGDVLRSEDLATPAGWDADFLAALREKLAIEPVVLAPERSVNSGAAATETAMAAGGGGYGQVSGSNRRRARRWSWMAPTAVAAGFVAVAGVLVVTRGPSVDTTPTPPLALAPEPPAQSQPREVSATTALPAVQVEPQARAMVVGQGRLIRDARLDSYLAAHKQFAGSSVLGVPSGFLRNAAAEVPSR